MWNFYLIFGTFCVVILSNSLSEAIIIKKRYKRSTNDNVLWNTSPPTVTKELQHGIKFFSEDVLRLECNIDGNPRPSYQWYISTTEVVDMSSNMQELQFDKVPSGNNYFLDINGTESDKKFFKYSYFCLAQNPLGILHSNKIIVEKVSKPKDVQIKYKLFNVDEGEKYVIQCNTVPDSWAGLFKFKRWEVRPKAGSMHYLNKTEGRFSVITSTKTPQLHIRNVTREDFEKAKFRCIFQSTVNNGLDVNDSFFRPLEKLSYDAPPYLSNKCGSAETITALVGNDIELPWCSIPKTLNVTWFKIENANMKIELATKYDDPKYQMVSRRYGNILILNATKEDSGKYMVITTGKFSPISLIYTVNVYDPASISLTPNSIEKELDQEVEFHCSSTYAKTQFYWLHNGRRVTLGYDDGNVKISSNNNESFLRIKRTRLSVAGVYQCIAAADNELKGISEYRQKSSSLLLTKISPFLYKQSPRVEKGTITAQMQISSSSKQKTIECIFSANPRPNIDWYLDSEKVPIKSLFTINIQNDPQSIYNFIAKLTINLDEVIVNDDKRKYAGEYQAVATNDRGQASCKTFVLVDGSLELRLPSKQIAVGDKDFLLSCYFIAMGVPEFSWDRKTSNGVWESMPSNHRTKMKDKNHKLLLKNVVKVEDEGDYRCTAKFNKETKIAITNLEVANPPNLARLPQKQDISENYYHMCTVSNKADQPWYVWWTFTAYDTNETKEIKPDIYKPLSPDFHVKYGSATYFIKKDVEGIPSFAYKHPNQGVNLSIKERSVDKSALGRFTCHAKNHIGSTSKTIEDNFLSLEFKVVPPSTSEVIVGNDLYLNCSPRDSDLKPYTRWRISYEDKYVDINDMKDKFGGRIYQYENGTLVMKSIRESDPSKIFCFLIPSRKNFDVQSKVAYIDIRVPARIQPMEKEIFKIFGTTFNMSCNVYGNTQNLVVKWLYKINDNWQSLYETCIYSRDNHCANPYPVTRKFNSILESHNISSHTVNLEFYDTMDSLTGHYRCMAENKFNRIPSEGNTHLTIISKPSKVLDFDQKFTTSTEIELKWQPPLNKGNRPILGYILTYAELAPFGEKKNTPHELQINYTELSKTIYKLKPYRTYDISISAKNEVGIGEASQTRVTTQEAKPDKEVRSLKASSTQPHEILITWDDPELPHQNGKITHYQVCYQTIPTMDDSGTKVPSSLPWPNSTDNIPSNSNDLKCEKSKESSLQVPNLPQFTDFGIRVIAFNVKGPSPPAFTKVRTLEDLPQAAPTNLICDKQQQNIQLHWNPPGRQTINGVLIGYVVQYYKQNYLGDESDMLSVNVQGATNIILDQLEPFTKYSIQVMAANRKGLGPPSAPLICKTLEAKPEAPDVVKGVRINNTCVSVSWLHTSKPYGDIKEYCIVDFGASLEKAKCQPPDFTKRYNYMVLCDRPEQYLKVRVFARNTHDGIPRDLVNIKEYNGIISIGGPINAVEGSHVLLMCETLKDDARNVVWKRDSRQISNNENPSWKIHGNNSLELIVEKYGHHTYSCSTEYDSIEYNLNVIDLPDGQLRPPYINDARVTENSIFVSWKSRGIPFINDTLKAFVLTWENLYTHESKTVTIENVNTRTFYLNNVTCASDIHVKIRAKNRLGLSDISNIKKLRTLGTVPQIADSAVLLPTKNIDYNSANFDLNAFGPGDNCSATYFTIEISLTSMGHNPSDAVLVNRNLSVFELENKCCCKITNLNPLTSYKYKIVAYNPAGSQMIYNTFKTLGLNEGYAHTKYNTVVPDHPFNQTWLLMIILVITVIIIMVFLILGVLYIFRNKEKRTRSTAETLPIRKSEFIQPRLDRSNMHEDTTSMDSNGEPSPYAVYQPDTDPKTNHNWPHQVPPTSSTPGYNYPDHLYNQIRYDKIHQFTRPENQGNLRRVNSAECLSSVGNASVSGIADLESPSNIDPNDRMGRGRGPNNDDVFQNIQFPSCATVNRSNKRLRRESENLRYAEEERINLMNQNPTLMMNWRNDPITFRNQQPSVYNKTGNPNKRLQYRQQLSVPEPIVICGPQFGYPISRQRTHSGVGTSQVTIPSSASQVNYGNYYETHCNQNAYSNAKRDNLSSTNNPSIEPYSKYIPNNHSSNYGSQHRTAAPRQEFIAANGNVPRPSRTEQSDDEIYADRVVIV